MECRRWKERLVADREIEENALHPARRSRGITLHAGRGGTLKFASRFQNVTPCNRLGPHRACPLMAKNEHDENPAASPAPADEPARARPRRPAMTPEQRRFLGTPRSREERAEQEAALPIAAPRKAETKPSSLPSHAAEPRPVLAPEEPQKPPAETRATIAPDDASAVAREHQPPLLKLDNTASRHSEMLRAVLILGALLFFLCTFYIGKNFERWKYWLFSARNAPKLEETTPDKFPGVSSDELVAQALELERAGRTQEAIDRFMAAKRKNLLHRGILYRVGKLLRSCLLFGLGWSNGRCCGDVMGRL